MYGIQDMRTGGKLVLIMDGNLTQEELDALLNNMNTGSDSNQDVVTDNNDGAIDGEGLSPEEMDAIGEIANILFRLVSH